MAFSIRRRTKEEEDQDIEDAQEVQEEEEAEEDTSEADIVARKKKQQRQIILIAGAASLVAVSAYVMLMPRDTPHVAQVQPARQMAAAPAARAEEEEALKALMAQQSPPPTDNPAPSANPAPVGTPGVRVDTQALLERIESMNGAIGSGFNRLGEMISTGNERILGKLDEIAKAKQAAPQQQGPAPAVSQRVSATKSVPLREAAGWRLVRTGEDFAVIERENGEFRLVRRGDAIPGLGRVMGISDDHIIVGNNVGRKG